MAGIDWEGKLLSPLMKLVGVPIVFTPALGVAVNLNGIFNEAHEEVTLLDDVPASTVSPAVGVNRSDLNQDPLQGDMVTIESTGETYVIRDVQPDGHGHILLLLNFHHSS